MLNTFSFSEWMCVWLGETLFVHYMHSQPLTVRTPYLP